MIPLLLLIALAGLMHAARSFTSSMSAGVQLAFGFLLLAAYFTGRLVSRLGLPRLTGYLIAGVLAGPFVLELVTPLMGDRLRIVNSVATCILGLTAGAELDLKKVRPILRTISWILLLGVIGAMVVLVGVLYAIRPLLPMFDSLGGAESLAVCLLIGVALSPQSPAIVLAVLAETRADGPLSQLMLATVVVSDLVVIVCYAIAAAITGAMLGGTIDVAQTVISVSWELVGSVVFGVAIGMLIGVFVRFVKEGAPMFALLVCVVVAEIGSRVHLDPLVVMLAAGIWLENFSKADAHALLHSFESAQLPVFLVWFALAGLRLDLPALWATALPVVIIVIARAAAFYAGTRLASARTRAAPAIARYGWTGLLPQAGLSLALMVLIQKTFPRFGGDAAVLLLSVLGVNQLLSPILLRHALVTTGEAGKRAEAEFAPTEGARSP